MTNSNNKEEEEEVVEEEEEEERGICTRLSPRSKYTPLLFHLNLVSHHHTLLNQTFQILPLAIRTKIK